MLAPSREPAAKGASFGKNAGRVATFITSGNPDRLTGSSLYNRRMMEALRREGLASTRLALPRGRFPLTIGNLWAAMNSSPSSVAIVDSLAAVSAGPLIGWMKQRMQMRVVALMRALPSDLSPSWQRAAVRLLESRLLRAADCVIAVSLDLRSRLIARGAPPDRVVVIMPGKDGVAPPQAVPNGCSHGQTRFLCVANWSPSKGIHLLIDALARLDDSVRLDLVGEPGDGVYARRVQGLLRESPGASRVQLHGPLEGEMLAQRYVLADAFVLPSRSEGFGTAYAEAMSFGLPVIACRVGPISWLVQDGCGVLVPTDDASALAEAMATVAGYPLLRRRMGKAALQRALYLPSWEESSKRFCALIGSLMQR